MLPDDNPENVLSNLKKVIADTSISVKCTYSSFVAPLSPLRDDVRIPVEQISASMWPGVKVSPVMSTGATDSKYLRRAGIPSYGISGMFADMDDVRAHGKDERIGVNDFYQGVEFMYRFIKAFLGKQTGIISNTSAMNTPIIEITDLSKFYGKTRGIEKVNLQISEGEIFGFIGPNGAGKSTTIRILLNLIFPTSGSARIMGMDVIRKTKKIKELVGYVPSDANAYGYMKVLEFLQLLPAVLST